jgi:transposase-like protein
MHCPRCKSLMAETGKTMERRCEEVRFECTVCRSLAITFRPLDESAGHYRCGSADGHPLPGTYGRP